MNTREIALALFTTCLLVSVQARANLLTNGGFETGDFTGWTQSGNVSYTFVGGNPQSGNYSANLGAVGSLDYLSQSFATTPGVDYNISYWLTSDGQTPNEFSVSWDGTTLSDLINIPTQAYTQYNFNVLATGNSSTLTFGSRNDPGYLYLDNVSVTPSSSVAEPDSLALLGLGLAGTILLRRKRSAFD